MASPTTERDHVKRTMARIAREVGASPSSPSVPSFGTGAGDALKKNEAFKAMA
jgi:hypothetical protein